MRHGEGVFYFGDDSDTNGPHRREGTWSHDKLEGIAKYIRGKNVEMELW